VGKQTPPLKHAALLEHTAGGRSPEPIAVSVVEGESLVSVVVGPAVVVSVVESKSLVSVVVGPVVVVVESVSLVPVAVVVVLMVFTSHICEQRYDSSTVG
jgi:hypothetical protein